MLDPLTDLVTEAPLPLAGAVVIALAAHQLFAGWVAPLAGAGIGLALGLWLQWSETPFARTTRDLLLAAFLAGIAAMALRAWLATG